MRETDGYGTTYREHLIYSMSEPFRPLNRVDKEERAGDRYERAMLIASWITGIFGLIAMLLVLGIIAYRSFWYFQ